MPGGTRTASDRNRTAIELDRDSDLVHNDFANAGGGYVEWTLTLDHAQALELVPVQE